jgi:hypothetical protein
VVVVWCVVVVCRVVFAGRTVVDDLDAVTSNPAVAVLPRSPVALTAYVPTADVAVVA